MADKQITRPPMTADEAVTAHEFYARIQNMAGEINDLMRDIDRAVTEIDEAPYPQPHSWATTYGRYLRNTLEVLGAAKDLLTPPEESF